jgi:hypothetical protein
MTIASTFRIGRGPAASAAETARIPAGPLEAVEDQIEPIFELVSEVVARLHGVFGDERDKVWVLVDGKATYNQPGCT